MAERQQGRDDEEQDETDARPGKDIDQRVIHGNPDPRRGVRPVTNVSAIGYSSANRRRPLRMNAAHSKRRTTQMLASQSPVAVVCVPFAVSTRIVVRTATAAPPNPLARVNSRSRSQS